MKTLQKYANTAFLLLSVATIVPASANPVINEQEQVQQEETTVKPQGITKRILQYAKDNKNTVMGTFCALTVAICLADTKYNFYKNHRQVYNLLSIPMIAMPIIGAYLILSDENIK